MAGTGAGNCCDSGFLQPNNETRTATHIPIVVRVTKAPLQFAHCRNELRGRDIRPFQGCHVAWPSSFSCFGSLCPHQQRVYLLHWVRPLILQSAQRLCLFFTPAGKINCHAPKASGMSRRLLVKKRRRCDYCSCMPPGDSMQLSRSDAASPCLDVCGCHCFLRSLTRYSVIFSLGTPGTLIRQ